MAIHGVLARTAGLALALVNLLASVGLAPAQETRRLILPEQRCVEVRDPTQLSRARIPDIPAPPTVSQHPDDEPVWDLPLDEAIRIALQNAEVIRVVAGNLAVASGATIYEPAIRNTAIDQQRGRFDPMARSSNTFSKTAQPFGAGVPPGPFSIEANPQDGFRSSTGMSKTLATGANLGWDVNVTTNHSRRDDLLLPLNPQVGNNVTLSVQQPLLQGAGSRANLAPILIARIQTERSFFQLKDSVQDLVLSVVQTYWSLAAAQTDRWARQRQVEQGEVALRRSEARMQEGFGHLGEASQARVSYENFRAALIAAEANVLNQEALLKNLLGLPPSTPSRIVPVTAPNTSRLPADWDRLLELAEQFRPDIIELKLVLEADQQQLLLARNQALPQVNLGALYRWNGLEGVTPGGERLSVSGGTYADWEAGVNFSVPLGLRRERAAIREQELIIQRDRVVLDQALHSAAHQLALSYRGRAQYYEQYRAYRRVREAAFTNAERQLADFLAGRPTLYLSVLLAITDWGNAVNAEFQSLVQYNTELARLERQTGTILDSHGVRFYEERYGSIGPLGRLFHDACYPRDRRPTPNEDSPPVPAADQYQRPAPIPLPPVDDEEDAGRPAEAVPAPPRTNLPAPRK